MISVMFSQVCKSFTSNHQGNCQTLLDNTISSSFYERLQACEGMDELKFIYSIQSERRRRVKTYLRTLECTIYYNFSLSACFTPSLLLLSLSPHSSPLSSPPHSKSHTFPQTLQSPTATHALIYNYTSSIPVPLIPFLCTGSSWALTVMLAFIFIIDLPRCAAALRGERPATAQEMPASIYKHFDNDSGTSGPV